MLPYRVKCHGTSLRNLGCTICHFISPNCEGCISSSCSLSFVQAKQNESKYTGTSNNDLKDGGFGSKMSGDSGFGSKSSSFGEQSLLAFTLICCACQSMETSCMPLTCRESFVPTCLLVLCDRYVCSALCCKHAAQSRVHSSRPKASCMPCFSADMQSTRMLRLLGSVAVTLSLVH